MTLLSVTLPLSAPLFVSTVMLPLPVAVVTGAGNNCVAASVTAVVVVTGVGGQVL